MDKILNIILVLIVTLVLLIAGYACSRPAETPAPPGPQPSPTPSQAGPQIGKLAPDFQLPDLDGQSVSLSDLRGKPVLLNFWATWCGPCRNEMPYIQAVYDEWSVRGLVVLAVDIDESPSQVQEFMESNRLSFPVLLDADGMVAQLR